MIFVPCKLAEKLVNYTQYQSKELNPEFHFQGFFIWIFIPVSVPDPTSEIYGSDQNTQIRNRDPYCNESIWSNYKLHMIIQFID